MTKPDSNVEAVRQKLLDRSRVGTQEHGDTTDRTDLTRLEWLQHLQDELMDASVYTQKLISLEHIKSEQATN